MKKLRFCCPCQFGLERVLKFEIGRIGGEDLIVQDGRILFSGSEELIAKANLWLRTAERVLLVLGEFHAESFEELFQGVRAIHFAEYIGERDAFPVKGSSLNSTLHSVPDCQSIIKKAAVESMKRRYRREWFEESGAVHQIRFTILKNRVSIYLDTTGVGLHKRGYRLASGAAPLRETLAAGIVDLAMVRTDSRATDPCCGSGTFLIEAAMKAMNIAPGLNRNFSACKWSWISDEIWCQARAEALDLIRWDSKFSAAGSDVDPEVLAVAAENARRANVADRIRFVQADLRKYRPECDTITFSNPPYGERMLSLREAETLYAAMGKAYRPDAAHPCHIISPHPAFEQQFGKRADKRRKLYNGMLQCQLYQYFRD